jgi:hypothetical protein
MDFDSTHGSWIELKGTCDWGWRWSLPCRREGHRGAFDRPIDRALGLPPTGRARWLASSFTSHTKKKEKATNLDQRERERDGLAGAGPCMRACERIVHHVTRRNAKLRDGLAFHA